MAPSHGTPIRDASGKVVGIACSRGPAFKPCSVCKSSPGTKLCDAPGSKPGRTCDAPLCARCSRHIPGADLDFCPKHPEVKP